MKNLSNIKFGWIPDEPDLRDFSATSLIYAAKPLPKNYFVYPNTYIYNQGNQPACVGYACAGVKTDEEFTQHHHQYRYDGLWLYQECKKVDGIPDTQGTYIRVALKILQEQGMRQTGTLCIQRQPDIDWKIFSYYRIDNTSDDDFIKQVIAQFGSIAVGSWWYNNWSTKFDVFPGPTGKNGGHAWKLAGWMTDSPAGWVVVNSWGKKLWGKEGIAIMPFDIFRSAILNEGADVWKLIDA
jgi:hypothetical protein